MAAPRALSAPSEVPPVPAVSLLVIIPTRNRFELADAAIGVVLRESAPLTLWVSDNSSSPEEAARLKARCEAIGDPRLHYWRPDPPLPMGQHWNGLLERGLAAGTFTHVTVLTDRMRYLPGALAEMAALAAQYPEDIVCFPTSNVHDRDAPVTLTQLAWTGRVVRVGSERALECARNRGWVPWAPRFMNAVTPFSVVRKVRAAYPDVCNADSPDVCFGYRALERLDSILYLDRPLALQYAVNRSNGHSFWGPNPSKDSLDFVKQLAKDRNSWFYSLGAVPNVPLSVNACINEYNLVAQQSRSPRFKPFNRVRGIRLVRRQLGGVGNAALREQMRSVVDEFDGQLRGAQRLRETLAAMLERVRFNASLRGAWRRAVAAACGLFDFRNRGTWAIAGWYRGPRPAQADVISSHASTAKAIEFAEAHEPPRRWGYSDLECKVGGARIATVPPPSST